MAIEELQWGISVSWRASATVCAIETIDVDNEDSADFWSGGLDYYLRGRGVSWNDLTETFSFRGT
jgi:hypothetical protein